MNGVPNAEALALEFYDRVRVATWVRSHEGLIPLVRTLVGRSIPGWQSYGSWASPDSVRTEYFLDDKVRIQRIGRQTDQGLSAAQGIQQIRDELRKAHHAVRLVGLSGVGKPPLVDKQMSASNEGVRETASLFEVQSAAKVDPSPERIVGPHRNDGIRTVTIKVLWSGSLKRFTNMGFCGRLSRLPYPSINGCA